MTQLDYLEQQAELLERENRRLLEDLAGLRAHIQRLQQDAHERIQAAQRELQAERARGRQQLAEDRERTRVVYSIPEDLQAALDARYALTAKWRYVVTGDGDQVDAEAALKCMEAWEVSVTKALKYEH